MDNVQKKEASPLLKLIGLVLLLFFLLVGFQVYSAWSDPYRFAKGVYEEVSRAYGLFPEGERFYRFALQNSVKLYRYSERLKEIYGDYSIVELVNGAANGDKRALKTLEFLLLASFSRWVVFAGIVYALLSKTFLFFAALLLLSVGFALLRGLKVFDWLKLELKALSLAEIRDGRVLKAIKVLLANPRPASINHHRSEENGLLFHSLEVAKEARKRARERGLDEREAYLGGLLHDVGKIKLYTKDERGNWVSTGAKEEVAQRLAMAELKEKFGLEEPKDEGIRRLVKEVDREVTARELWRAFKSLDFDAGKLLRELIPKLRYHFDGKLLAVPAKEINPAFTERLEEMFGINLPSEVNFETSVHPIAAAHPYREFLLLKVDGKYADHLDLFNAKVDGKRVKAVYVFDAEKLGIKPEKNAERIEVEERNQEAARI